MKLRLLLLCTVALGGCQLPSYRVFQKEVPDVSQKPAATVEGERRAASYVAKRSGLPVTDFEMAASALRDINSVAVPLSASLGEPKVPVVIETPKQVVDELKKVAEDIHAAQLATQKQIQAFRDFSKDYQGTKLEGTGFDIFKPGSILLVIGIIAACIFVPGFIGVLFTIIARLRGAVRKIAQGVEEFQAAKPDEGAELKEYLDGTMDEAHKKIVKKEKAHLDAKRIIEAAATQTPPVSDV